MNTQAQVIIVGAGPVGLSAAMFLIRHGVSVLVLEKRATLSTASKASTFHPPTLEMLEEFGIISSVLAQGQIADRIQYRSTSGEVLAEFDHALLRDITRHPYRLHLEQNAVTQLLLAELTRSPLGDVRFGCAVEDAGTDGDQAWVDVRVADNPVKRMSADFVIGADGARSVVRDALGITMAGEEYPGKVLRLVITDPLERILPGLGQISYIYAPDGESLSLLQMPDCWRVIIRLPEGFDPEDILRPEWYMPVVHRLMPEAPPQLALRTSDIYGARKMLSASAGTGRVFLAGDALHLTNTRGGMNMNCGIHDAYELGQAIVQALRADDPALAQAAARHRWQIAKDELLPRTDRNVQGGDSWLAHVQRTAAIADTAKQMLVRTAMLDMAPPRLGISTQPAEAEV